MNALYCLLQNNAEYQIVLKSWAIKKCHLHQKSLYLRQ